jgi:hypothetical protein
VRATHQLDIPADDTNGSGFGEAVISLVAFVFAVAALVRWTAGWTRALLITILVLGAIGLLLG